VQAEWLLTGQLADDTPGCVVLVLQGGSAATVRPLQPCCLLQAALNASVTAAGMLRTSISCQDWQLSCCQDGDSEQRHGGIAILLCHTGTQALEPACLVCKLVQPATT
jgi:hypothetical protein